MLNFLAIGLLAALGAPVDLAPGPLQRGLEGAGCSYSQWPAPSATLPITLARAVETSYGTPAFLAVDSRSAEDAGIAIARIQVGSGEQTLDRNGKGGSGYVSTRGDLRVGIRAVSRAQSICEGRECEGTFRLVNVHLARGTQHAKVRALEHCGA